MRKPVVSRTLTTLVVTFLVINKETRETEERTISIPKTKKVEKSVKETLEENIVFVALINTEEVKQKYAIPVEQFMELAIPVADNEEVEEAE